MEKESYFYCAVVNGCPIFYHGVANIKKTKSMSMSMHYDELIEELAKAQGVDKKDILILSFNKV